MTINSDSCYKGKPLKRPETCLFWYTKYHVKLYDYQFSPMPVQITLRKTDQAQKALPEASSAETALSEADCA